MMSPVRAILCETGGDPSVLRVAAVPTPEPGPGQVRTRVAYAGVNFADVVMRRGELSAPFPLVPGVEGAGVVDAVGPGVEGLAIGGRVAWAPVKQAASIGSYGEHQLVGAAQAIPVPDDISLRDAAAITLQGLTAHYLVHDQVRLGPGVTVLVHAAAGGTGSTVVRWASHLGATVLATVSSEAKAAVAREAGASHVIRYDEVDFVDEARRLTDGRGVDYIVDGVAAGTFRAGLRALADCGRICVFGRAAGMPEMFSPMELLARSLVVAGGSMHNFLRTRDEVLAKSADVWQGVRKGWLAPHLHGVFALEDAPEAHRLLESRATTGKLVLEVCGES